MKVITKLEDIIAAMPPIARQHGFDLRIVEGFVQGRLWPLCSSTYHWTTLGPAGGDCGPEWLDAQRAIIDALYRD